MINQQIFVFEGTLCSMLATYMAHIAYPIHWAVWRELGVETVDYEKKECVCNWLKMFAFVKKLYD